MGLCPRLVFLHLLVFYKVTRRTQRLVFLTNRITVNLLRIKRPFPESIGGGLIVRLLARNTSNGVKMIVYRFKYLSLCRSDVLINTKHVIRIILTLQNSQPLIFLSIALFNAVFAFISNIGQVNGL
jgi:hypothetical protein